ncbi:thiamine biosynthesis lipoprotein [Sphingobacterium yanglingense]|uniref:FAD:protein FMN transferase n=1 Tax=Sphingobacterium yanglingense TaxID=1437280 RepID=A0A4R6WEL7_9SPHI|nr:thiamine biosynthesis lipoprotein [Sphingobacterium yanglingense]
MVLLNIHRLLLCFSTYDYVRGYFFSIIFFALGCCAYGQHPYALSGKAQGTTYQIKYYSDKEKVLKSEVDSVLGVIDRSMSLYDMSSTICQFNNPDTSQVIMDRHMKKVIDASMKTYKETSGYFDITVYPLVKLWGFGASGARTVPSLREVDSVKQIIGMNKLRIKGNCLMKLERNVSIDLNGIAQGYSVDVLAEHLKSRGVKNFLVELGGEIRSVGSKPDGPFVVELYRPTHIAKGEMLRVKMSNNAITSSGVYEQQRKVNGKMISHHMNPLTGQPLQSSIVSATVIAKTAMEADALDNYFMSLTPKEAIRFANKRKGIEVYIVYFEDNTFKELQSSGFNSYIY